MVSNIECSAKSGERAHGSLKELVRSVERIGIVSPDHAVIAVLVYVALTGEKSLQPSGG